MTTKKTSYPWANEILDIVEEWLIIGEKAFPDAMKNCKSSLNDYILTLLSEVGSDSDEPDHNEGYD